MEQMGQPLFDVVQDIYNYPFTFPISSFPQGHETSALLILEKVSDRNLINCTNAALQTYVLFCRPQANTLLVQQVNLLSLDLF